LRELGWIEGENLIVERRWAHGYPDRLPALTAEVIERNVDLIFTGGTPAAIAAKNATSTIPIVAVRDGRSCSLRAGAQLGSTGRDLTGASMGYGADFGGKWLQLLQESVPRLSTVAMIVNPDNFVAHDPGASQDGDGTGEGSGRHVR